MANLRIRGHQAVLEIKHIEDHSVSRSFGHARQIIGFTAISKNKSKMDNSRLSQNVYFNINRSVHVLFTFFMIFRNYEIPILTIFQFFTQMVIYTPTGLHYRSQVTGQVTGHRLGRKLKVTYHSTQVTGRLLEVPHFPQG